MKTPHIRTSAKAALLAIAASLVGAASLSAQVVTYTVGDLLVGFRASGGTGSDTTFVFNIGSSVGFRNNPSQGTLATVGIQLSSVYGSNWFTRTDVSWGVIGVRTNANPQFENEVVGGDPVSTIYASRGGNGINTTTAWGTPTAFTRAPVVGTATQITGFTHTGSQVAGTFAFQTAAANTGGFGAIVPTSVTNDWANYTAPNADFGLFVGGIENTFGTGNQFSYLDLYRILATTTGANPTGTLGRGAYVTSFTIDSAGAISAIPEPSSAAALIGLIALGAVASRRRRHVKA